MSNASKELGRDLNNNRVGLKGGTSPKDINNSSSNRLGSSKPSSASSDLSPGLFPEIKGRPVPK